ncbi:MAG: hypothetical protein H6807_11940 [Planctomycetes bacterium]|nr:hypothetical protein [Planctomycetota bacterium]
MNRSLSIPVLVLLLAVGVLAQQGLDLRIEVSSPGLHEIRWFDLAAFAGDRPLDTERLMLTRNGVEVPISFRAVNGTRFDRSSAIQFYAEAGDGVFSKKLVYRLQSRPGTRRIGERALGRSERTVGEAVVIQRFEEDLIHDPMATVQERWLDLGPEARGTWFWARLAPPDERDKNRERSIKNLLLRLEVPPRPVDRTPATLRIRLRGHLGEGVEQSLKVAFGALDLGERSWTDPNLQELVFELPVDALRTDNVLRLENSSKAARWADPGNQVHKSYPNDILIDSVELDFKTLLTGPTGRDPQLVYEIETPGRDGRVLLRFTNPGASPFRLFDVARQSWLRGNEIDLPAGQRLKVAVCSSEGYRSPVEVGPWSKRDLRQEREGGDWVCIALDRFAEFVEPLAEWRASQGLKPLVVTDREIYDAFSGGDFDPRAITRFLTNGMAAWKHRPRFVLLVGDADHDVDWVSDRRVLPTAMVPTYYNGLGASDRGLMPDDEVAVGRFPARRADEVIRMVARTIDYEKGASNGAWRRRLNMIASEGRFGPVVDQLIERYAARMLTEVVPAAYDVTMTYASRGSAYLYPPTEFNDQVIHRFNEGALVFAYMGHGYSQGFDELRLGKQRFPIFAQKDVGAIDAGARSPLAVIIACSTAEFDEPEKDAIAENMMRTAGGPLALIGGTRITHPFANSLLSKELLARLFGPENPTIGEALAGAQRALAADWQNDPVAMLAKPLVGRLDVGRLMRDHQHLYLLFGDPATRLARPRDDIRIEAKASAQAVEVSGRIEAEGVTSVRLSLEIRRDRIATALERPDADDPAAVESIKANYRKANDKVILSREVPVTDGAFAITLALPEGSFPTGPAVVKAWVETGSGPIVGATDVDIPEAPAGAGD